MTVIRTNDKLLILQVNKYLNKIKNFFLKVFNSIFNNNKIFFFFTK